MWLTDRRLVLLPVSVVFVQIAVTAFGLERIISFETAHHLLAGHRMPRSVEGGNCSFVSSTGQTVTTDPCTTLFSYTKCDPIRSACVCDLRVATKFTVLPGYAVCAPLSFTNNSGGQCIFGLFPDMCELQVTGSVCSLPMGTPRKSMCTCIYGGTWPNCIARLGGRCANTTVCTNRIPNSFCGNFNASAGFGNCGCPRQGDLLDPGAYYGPPGTNSGSSSGNLNSQQTLQPSGDQQTCMPTMCPPATPTGTTALVNPCKGDAGFFQCNNKTGGGYQCECINGARGRSHNLTTPGICCSSTKVSCSDFSMCIDATKMCDGTPDCPDCSDEKYSWCSSQWPQVPQCGPPQRSDEEARSFMSAPLKKDNRMMDISQLSAVLSDRITFPAGKSYNVCNVNHKMLHYGYKRVCART